MKHLLSNMIAVCLILALAGITLAGQSVEIRLRDGSAWRGEVSEMVKVTFIEQNIEVNFTGKLVKVADLYIIVEGNIAGELLQKTIFRGDLIAMSALGEDDAEDALSGLRARPKPGEVPEDDDIPRTEDGRPLGVIVLPLEGMVGGPFRHDEIDMIGEEADKYGPGQIIVLLIKSNGGLVWEEENVIDSIRELKKRHRVVAWVEKALSAGAMTAMACPEIYFMTEGSCGSVTTISGQTAVRDPEYLAKQVQYIVDVAVENNYNEHLARAMKMNNFMCSYDKDPETGEITWYGDTSGEVVLSDENSNLCFTSKTALACGFSKGTADTEEDLAKLLDLPRWYEISDYGRKIAKKWQDTCERADKEIPRLIARLSYYKSAGSTEEQIGARIQILEKLIKWWDRAPLIAAMKIGAPKEYLEREVEELRRALARMRKR